MTSNSLHEVTPVGIDHALPKDWHNNAKNDALKYKSKIIKIIQLWCNQRLMGTRDESVLNQVHSVKYNVIICSKMMRQQAFVPEYAYMYYLTIELWIMDGARKLCCVVTTRKPCLEKEQKGPAARTQ